MKQATTGWIEKAEEDFDAARQLLESSNPLFGVACFHAQQCVGKKRQSIAQAHEMRVPRVHDLDALAAQGEPIVPQIAGMRHEFEQLTTYAVDIRYPGPPADRAEADQAVATATTLRRIVRGALGISLEMD
ncbi:MAG: HEPN domain-containing protein [Thermomicrobiales bacterium]